MEQRARQVSLGERLVIAVGYTYVALCVAFYVAEVVGALWVMVVGR